MYQGTTPTLVLTVTGAEDLDEATCYVTIANSTGKKITKTGDDLAVSDNQIAVHLTQEETLQLQPGSCEVQVRWIDANGNAMATDKAVITVEPVLLKEVIEYQEGTG